LKLCLHSFTETNEITNEMLTLRQCGCVGVIPEVSVIKQQLLNIMKYLSYVLLSCKCR
jgi:Tat protein secretion system quality control protein TatD with DNase activity